MPKAVLVIEMPERCDKCLLLLKIPQKDGLALCLARQANNGQEEYNPKHEESWRPNWCPLRELPERKEPEIGGHGEKMFRAGFNACLDEITS